MNAQTYRRRAEDTEQAAANARDPEAKRLFQKAAQRWWQLAELAERSESEDQGK
jgi:hypothetical protein